MFDIETLLIELGSYHTVSVVIATMLLWGLRDRQGMRFAAVTTFFYILANLYFDYLIAWDSANLYRYFVWFSHDLLWMATIAYFSLRDKLELKQSVLGQLLCLPILCLNLLRAIDMATGQFNFSLTPYQIIYPVCETAIVVLCWLPVVVALKAKVKFSQVAL